MSRQGPGPDRFQFERRPPKPTMHPRKVMGGVRLKAKSDGTAPSWIVQRWMRVVEESAPAEQLAEGLEYAKMGQARSLQIGSGVVASRVQGRMPKAYEVRVRVPTLAPAQWEQLLELLRTQARFVASLLAGELPPSVEDLFGPLGLKLFPTQPSDLAPSCTCEIAKSGATAWCKHVCCAMALVGERLATEPFGIFELRGMSQEDLLERVRQLRIASGATRGGLSPVVRPHLADVPERLSSPLEGETDRFWSMGPEVSELDLPVDAPELAHPLLRRLGPSPFPKAKFPLVGLLATCYEVISEAAVRDAAPPGVVEGAAVEAGEEAGEAGASVEP